MRGRWRLRAHSPSASRPRRRGPSRSRSSPTSWQRRSGRLRSVSTPTRRRRGPTACSANSTPPKQALADLQEKAQAASFNQPARQLLAGAPTQATGNYVFPVGGGPSVVSVSHTHHDYPAADIAAPQGSPVYALTDGSVLYAWLDDPRCGMGFTFRRPTARPGRTATSRTSIRPYSPAPSWQPATPWVWSAPPAMPPGPTFTCSCSRRRRTRRTSSGSRPSPEQPSSGRTRRPAPGPPRPRGSSTSSSRPTSRPVSAQVSAAPGR